ncbi:MAG TPA: hypothetical protein DF296_13255 [Candidatus Margulisbacteria bacterium]|nr:hypothetical protein [Candidatus Margulisiibacteriota bacterium]
MGRTEIYLFKKNEPGEHKKFSRPVQKSLGACPRCGGDVIENQSGYSCNKHNENRCEFVIWKVIARKSINKTRVRQLLMFKETDKIKGFTSKKGNKFDASLVINSGNVELKFW